MNKHYYPTEKPTNTPNRYYYKNPDSLQSRLANIKKKMYEGIKKNKNQLANIHQDAKKLYVSAEQSNKQYERQAQIQMDRLKDVTNSINQQLEFAVLQRKKRQQSILSSFQAKVQLLRLQIDKQRKTRQQLFSQISGTLEQDIPTIMDEVIIGKDELQNQQEKLQENTQQILQQTSSLLADVIQQQNNNTNKASEMIKNLRKKVNEKIQQEKQACEQTYQDVLQYIEQTCEKLSDHRQEIHQSSCSNKNSRSY